jgi:hypothetical protein
MKMLVKISGKNDKMTRKEMLFATKFFASHLMTERMCKSLSIDVRCNPHHYCYGSSVWTDDNHRPKEFEIILDSSIGKRTQLITLAHEMVHVKQHATGELKSLLRKRVERWKGEYIRENTLNYFDMPWEIEAYGRELGLYQMYMQWKKDNKLKF